MIQNALNSIKELNYDNWELAFIDDGSVDYPGEPIVREILKDHLHKIKFYNTEDSVEVKMERQSRHGLFMTQSVLDSNADLNFVLCDDDAITPNYLTDLNKYFTENPTKQWGYSHVIIFDPTSQDYHNFNIESDRRLNYYQAPVNPSCLLDSSQVAWRTDCLRKDNIHWNYPQTGTLDAGFFAKMYDKYGACDFMNCIGQYKGLFSDQMSHRKDYVIKIH
jgi:glycosyltransferase involved in cell wall biosynthesis